MEVYYEWITLKLTLKRYLVSQLRIFYFKLINLPNTYIILTQVLLIIYRSDSINNQYKSGILLNLILTVDFHLTKSPKERREIQVHLNCLFYVKHCMTYITYLATTRITADYPTKVSHAPNIRQRSHENEASQMETLLILVIPKL